MRFRGFNKGVVAAGMLVGIAMVAGIMRIQFMFNPPEDHFTNRVDTILDSVKDLDFTENTNANINTGVILPDAVEVLPTTIGDAYAAATTHDLGEGIVLQLQQTADAVLALVLQGNQLLWRTFDSNWKQVSEGVLREQVNLVNGQLPWARLYPVPTGYALVLQQPSGLTVDTYTDSLELGQSTTLSSTVKTVTMRTVVSGNHLWVLEGNVFTEYNLTTGLPESTQNLPGTPCDVIGNTDGVVVVSYSDTKLQFNKLDALGTVLQRADIPVLTESCQAVVRSSNMIVVQTAAQLQPYSDNLQQAYTSLPITNGVYHSLTLTTNAMWLANTKSETLGSYHSQVMVYPLLTL